MLVACQIDDEMHTVYDVYYKTAFTTDSTSAVLSSAAKADSLDEKWDEWLRVKGGFEYVTSDVVEYGHCWAKGDTDPVINPNKSNCIPRTETPNAKVPFYSTIPGLECETEYSVRSYVITKDGKIGYNPETLVVSTDHPHDKWFATQGLLGQKITANRSDCVNIMTIVNDDTLTFFGMGRSGDICYNDMWCYSSKKKIYEQIPDVKSNTGEIMRLWGAVGFGINFVENDIPHHLVYVGCGCTKPSGDIRITDYNQKFFVYDIDVRQWAEVHYRNDDNSVIVKQPFTGQPRTGAIGFSIREWGFVGLGEFQNGSTRAYHEDIYLFIMDQDESKHYTPTSGHFNPVTEEFGFGRRSGASVVVVDEMAYIIGGVGSYKKDASSQEETIYYDDFIPCRFTLPINSRPDSYTFTWPKAENVKRISDAFTMENEEGEKITTYNFKPRAYATAFAVGNSIYYGMGEGVGDDGNKEYYSNMVKYDLSVGYVPKVCAPYQNEDSPESRVSRTIVVNGGDRAYVIGGEKMDGGDGMVYNGSEWVYRP